MSSVVLLLCVALLAAPITALDTLTVKKCDGEQCSDCRDVVCTNKEYCAKDLVVGNSSSSSTCQERYYNEVSCDRGSGAWSVRIYEYLGCQGGAKHLQSLQKCLRLSPSHFSFDNKSNTVAMHTKAKCTGDTIFQIKLRTDDQCHDVVPTTGSTSYSYVADAPSFGGARFHLYSGKGCTGNTYAFLYFYDSGCYFKDQRTYVGECGQENTASVVTPTTAIVTLMGVVLVVMGFVL